MKRRFGEDNPAAKAPSTWVVKARKLNAQGLGPARIQRELEEEGLPVPVGTIKGWLYSGYRKTEN